jgi:hypothetical protein
MTHPALFATARQPTATDERWTPPWLFDAMRLAFDVDVAAPPGGVPWIPAARSYCAVDDGLAQPWAGLVWCNPPFSDPAPWVARWIDHANGVLLFPWNVNATWLHRLLEVVSTVAVLKHVRFVHPTHTGRHVPVAVALTEAGAGIGACARVAATGRATLLEVVT